MVFKFLNRGKGKKSEFFLEAPPLSHEAEAKLAEVKHVVEAKVDELKETVAKVADAIEEKVEQSSIAQDLKAKIAPPDAKAKKFKKAKAERKEAGSVSEGKAAESKAAPKPLSQPAPEPVKNFATDFLMPSATPRRRPGPSMDMFRDMAKDVNPRK